MIRFVIFAAPRTGSNMLCTMLNSHPDILCHHELFNPNGIFVALHLRDTDFSLGSIEQRQQSHTAFLENVWANAGAVNCAGLKLTHKQHEPAFELLLRDPSVHKIVLRRRNRVKTYVSHLVSEQSMQWEVYDTAELEARPKVTVDLVKLNARVTHDEEYHAYLEKVLRDTNQPSIEVYYEQLRESDEQVRLLQFLKQSTDFGTLSIASVKQNPAALKDMVENFDELAAALKGTDLESDLYTLDP
jgi:LPS sulfotransferase NodH